MKNHFTHRIVIMTTLITLCTSSCVNDQNLYQDSGGSSEKIPKEQFFDYDLTQEITINIDYCFPNNDYVVLFELYDQNPIEEKANGTTEKKDIAPIYSASTDKKGTYNGTTTILSELSEIWLYSDFLGTVSPVKLSITNHRISFNQNEYIAGLKKAIPQVKGITNNQHSYTDDWLTLGDWDNVGEPEYLSPTIATPPSDIMYSIKDTYKKVSGKDIKNFHPEFFDGNMISDVPITKPTKMSLVFITSGAVWNNAVGYFTYPTGETPDVSNIKKILAFPNASPIYKLSNGNRVGSLLCGSQVELKYWDGTKFQDEFPAGVTIGFCLQGMGFNNGNIVAGQGTRYSTKELNNDQKQRVVSLREPSSNQIVAIGFEDNIDFDYRDAIFYLHVETEDAIDKDKLPELPDVDSPSNEDNSITYSGTLTFEDLWPSDGDYDMNDVMVDYTSTVYRTIMENRVYKIVDIFTPRHSGGRLQSGFGYQLHNLSPNDILSIQIEGGEVSSYMENTNMEAGQSHPTILLFDNIKTVIGREYTVTINLKEVKEGTIKAPYNPFIFVEQRGTEVHLVNYPPTDKATLSLLGTKEDLSRPEDELYYVSKKQMPFAIHLPVKDFPIPEESVRIDQAYPKFRSWVDSQGEKDQDWYKYRKE